MSIQVSTMNQEESSWNHLILSQGDVPQLWDDGVGIYVRISIRDEVMVGDVALPSPQLKNILPRKLRATLA